MHMLLALTHCLSPGSCHPFLPVPASPLLSHGWCHNGTMMPKPWQSMRRTTLTRIIHMRLLTLQRVHVQHRFKVFGLQSFHSSGGLSCKSVASENHCGLLEYLKPSHDCGTSWVLPRCARVTHHIALKQADVKRNATRLFHSNTPSTSQQNPPFWSYLSQ